MSFRKDVALPTTLADMLKAKEQAVAKMLAARKLVQDAEQLLSEVGPYIYPSAGCFQAGHDMAMKDMNQRLWRRAFDLTGFRQLMDAEAVAQFERDLEKTPPDFTEDNIRSTFITLHQDAGQMFRRGIVNVFRYLSEGYKTNSNEPFRVGEKIICDHMVTNFHAPKLRVQYYNHASHRLDDIDRVFKTLDDQNFTPHTLESAINGAWEDPDNGNVYEDAYFRIKGFKKGSMHIWFKRLDLLERINELIAEHYGENTLAGAA